MEQDNKDNLEDQNSLLITINYRGMDILTRVDVETANILLNDPELAEEYVIKNNLLVELNELEPTCIGSSGSEGNELIWSTKGKNTTSKDEEATQLLLRMRAKLESKFADKKTSKQRLWTLIAKELATAGFNVGNAQEGAIRCRQKFANLQRTYFNYITHMRKTGEGQRDPPPFFNELHDVLGSKDKTNPTALEDSIKDEENATEESVKNRFKSTSSSVRPKSNMDSILTLLQTEREERAAQFRVIESALNVQNKQRDRLLDLLEQSLKKRKRKSESSESD